MKSLYIILFLIVLLTVGCVIEQIYIDNVFDELEQRLTACYRGMEANEVKVKDIFELTDWWNTQKEFLHAVIPHNDIRELESYLSQTKTYVEYGEKTKALANLQVLVDLSRAIPKTYKFAFENIF